MIAEHHYTSDRERLRRILASRVLIVAAQDHARVMLARLDRRDSGGRRSPHETLATARHERADSDSATAVIAARQSPARDVAAAVATLSSREGG